MPPCKNDPKSSYQGTEPSPKGLGYCAHAEKVGKKMKGKDGNMWIIKETSKKIKRWVKFSGSAASLEKKSEVKKKASKENGIFTKVMRFFSGSHNYEEHYLTHDNGGRPFCVYISPKNEVSIYKRVKYDGRKHGSWENYDKLPYDVFITKLKAKKVIIGKDKKLGSFGDGNSILLEMGKNKYVCITDNIFEFSLENGDEFVKYFSEIGNSDVPYPVLLGKNYFYSMIDKTRGSRSYFPENYSIEDYANGHDFYYGTWDKKKGWITEVKDIKKLKNYKEIEKRFYG
jgi:hypothetical protein